MGGLVRRVLAVEDQDVVLRVGVVDDLRPLDPEGQHGGVATGQPRRRDLDLGVVEDGVDEGPGEQIGGGVEVDAEGALEEAVLALERQRLLGRSEPVVDAADLEDAAAVRLDLVADRVMPRGAVRERRLRRRRGQSEQQQQVHLTGLGGPPHS